jgi:polar amino acid transport system substrate-binding protein
LKLGMGGVAIAGAAASMLAVSGKQAAAQAASDSLLRTVIAVT